MWKIFRRAARLVKGRQRPRDRARPPAVSPSPPARGATRGPLPRAGGFWLGPPTSPSRQPPCLAGPRGPGDKPGAPAPGIGRLDRRSCFDRGLENGAGTQTAVTHCPSTAASPTYRRAVIHFNRPAPPTDATAQRQRPFHHHRLQRRHRSMRSRDGPGRGRQHPLLSGRHAVHAGLYQDVNGTCIGAPSPSSD